MLSFAAHHQNVSRGGAFAYDHDLEFVIAIIWND
jgi:hypothetical protein